MQTSENKWLPIESHPKDGTPFLIAEYAPTSWAYHVRHVRPLPYVKDANLARFLETSIRYARGWMPLPVPPTE